MVALCPKDSADEDISFLNEGTEEVLFDIDELVVGRSENCLRTPTTPTSRRIAPAVPADRESGDGTWTGSEEDEYTPITEFVDVNEAFVWE